MGYERHRSWFRPSAEPQAWCIKWSFLGDEVRESGLVGAKRLCYHLQSLTAHQALILQEKYQIIRNGGWFLSPTVLLRWPYSDDGFESDRARGRQQEKADEL
jgi:hypothetical protein